MKRLLLFVFVFYFQSIYSQQLAFPMYFEDAAGNKDTITLGYDPNATYGIDSIFGESNIMGQAFKQGLDVRISDATAYFDESDSGTFELKKQIVKFNCTSWNYANCIEINTKNWPVTVCWDKSLFANNCNFGTFFSSCLPGGFFDVRGPSSLVVSFLKDTNTVTFTDQVLGSMYIGKIKGNDTISYFWQSFLDSASLSIEIQDVTIKNQGSEILVSPNPSKSQISLSKNDFSSFPNSNLQIFNTQGKLVKEIGIESNLHQITIDIQSLNSGMYFGKIISESGESLSFKCVKE